jgi:hypothetical protein
MAIIFVGNGAWGTGKGARLAVSEADGNIFQLLSRIVALEDTPPTPNNIASFEVVGATFTVVMQDATEFGPFQLPISSFAPRGEYVAATVYEALDLVTVSGRGLYLVNRDHTAPATFNPDLLVGGNPAYYLLIPEVSVHDITVFVPDYPGLGLAVDDWMYSYIAARPFYLEQDLPGSLAFFEGVPDANISYPIYYAAAGTVDYVLIGAINFTAANRVGTFTMNAGQQFAAGDRLLVGLNVSDATEPAVIVDPTAKDLSFVVKGTRGFAPTSATT